MCDIARDEPRLGPMRMPEPPRPGGAEVGAVGGLCASHEWGTTSLNTVARDDRSKPLRTVASPSKRLAPNRRRAAPCPCFCSSCRRHRTIKLEQRKDTNMKTALLIAALLASTAGSANAAIENLAISGDLDGHAYTGELSLNVSGGQAVSGSGTLSILGMTNAPLVMITASTSYNEAPGVGFRANDGTDYFDLDQAYPISANGLLFDVGTTTAQFGAFPLFTVWSNGGDSYAAAFTGNVGGTDYYNMQGSASVSAGAVPEPSTWAMMGIGFLGLAFAGFRQRKNRLATI
jgi:hypothetical protein